MITIYRYHFQNASIEISNLFVLLHKIKRISTKLKKKKKKKGKKRSNPLTVSGYQPFALDILKRVPYPTILILPCPFFAICEMLCHHELYKNFRLL